MYTEMAIGTHIYLINSRGEFLVHLRSPHKDTKPNTWDTRFGGHVVAGKDYAETALDELNQEIGLRPTQGLMPGPLEHYNGETNREHIQVYFYEFNGDLSDLHFNDNEVVEVKWMTPEQIRKSMESEPAQWAASIHGFNKVLQFWIDSTGRRF